MIRLEVGVKIIITVNPFAFDNNKYFTGISLKCRGFLTPNIPVMKKPLMIVYCLITYNLTTARQSVYHFDNERNGFLLPIIQKITG